MKHNTFYTWLKKNAITVLLTGFVLLLFISPDAKAWLLQRLVSVGLFKADIKKEGIQNQPGTTSFL
ncbi:MAG: hypothetical protein ACXWWD_05445, partial [Chitinophagaceae bacterium]